MIEAKRPDSNDEVERAILGRNRPKIEVWIVVFTRYEICG